MRVVAFPIIATLLAIFHGCDFSPDREDTNCRECRIIAETTITLAQDRPGAEVAGIPLNVAEDATGRIWVFSAGTPPLVFDSTGRFIRAAGAEGDGPGEFRWANGMISLPGDSVLVIDAVGRGTVIAGDFRVARVVGLPGRMIWEGIPLQWPHQTVINAAIPTPESIGWPLHLVDLSGTDMQVSKSFGTNGGELLPHPGQYGHLRNYLAGIADTVLSSEVDRYRVTTWSRDGQQYSQLAAAPAWFAKKSDLLIGGPEHPPSPMNVGLSISGDYLWSYTLVASDDYPKAWARAPAPSGGSGFDELSAGEIDIPLLYRTRISVLRRTDSQILKRSDWPGMVVAVLSRSRIVTYSETITGKPEIRIVSLKLVAP